MLLFYLLPEELDLDELEDELLEELEELLLGVEELGV